MNLYIYNYNNYYNRIVRKENSLEDYEPYLIYGPVQGVYGFTQGDGVNTTQLIGSNAQVYNGDGDYLIVNNPVTNEIDSRWFIISADRTRDGQWKLTLRRDLVVDYYDAVITAPCFIEKATLTSTNPLVFNSEVMTVNQIKTSETLLMDETRCPWFVGYYSDTVSQLSGTLPINEQIPGVLTLSTPIQNWEFYQYCSYNYQEPQNKFRGEIQAASYEVWFDPLDWTELDRGVRIEYNDFAHNVIVKQNDQGSSLNGAVESVYVGSALSRAGLDNNSYIANKLFSTTFGKNLPVNLNTQNEINEFKQLNGITVLDSNGKKFKVTLGTTSTEHISANITAGASFNTFKEWVNKANELGWSPYEPGVVLKGEPNNESFKAAASVITYTLLLSDVVELEGTIDYLISSDKVITEDAPWNIFAIPYGSVSIKNPDGSLLVQTDQEIGFRAASAMLRQHPVEIYDIQLLPYCPFEFIDDADGSILLQNSKQYGVIKQEEQILGVILNISKSRFTKTLTQYSRPQSTTVIEKKLHNECDKWRLTAPNYSNYFDFSIEKNNGVSAFNIDCDYKPYTPYIHINPIFAGLYGYDDNSPRGLVCGGDYSLAGVVEQWQNYQLNNKNFQLIFDRQIQNMEVQQKVGRIQDIVSGISGVIPGAVSGAMTGGMVGGPWGAAAGAVVGGAASAIGAVADYRLNEMLRNEAIDYTKDQFGYKLGNIQAMPNTISKVSALNNNNKIFPVLEFYTCTDEEKDAFLRKIAWNGMTVGVIGTIEDYKDNTWSYNEIESQGYIKGQLIKLPDLDINYNVLNSLAGEINKGVFIK